MIIIPGHCIKCGKNIARGNSAGHLYHHIRFEMSDGSGIAIAICNICEIVEADWPQIMTLFNEYQRINSSNWIDDERHIVREIDRQNMAELRLGAQGGRCYGCHDTIIGEYVITNGYVMHENCNLPRPMDIHLLRNFIETGAGLPRQER